MKKSILLALIILLAFTNITSAQLVFDGGPDGTGTDFFDEANWVDTETGMDPAADTINPLVFSNGVLLGTIEFDLTVSGAFAVVAEGLDEDLNIRIGSGRTLTLEDNATLICQLLTAPAGGESNIVLSDNAELTVGRIARTAFDLSGNANLMFVPNSSSPEFTTDRINFSAAWTGDVTTGLPNFNRTSLMGEDGSALFNTATIDGVAGTDRDFNTILFGADIIHNIPLRGDVNRDEVVNFLDIAEFIVLLSISPNGFRAEADLNVDGVTNFLDISPFIQVLAGGGQ